MSYVNNLDHCFSVIGLSETWLNPSNVSAYGIPGGRLNKKDGLTRYGNSHVKDKTS